MGPFDLSKSPKRPAAKKGTGEINSKPTRSLKGKSADLRDSEKSIPKGHDTKDAAKKSAPKGKANRGKNPKDKNVGKDSTPRSWNRMASKPPKYIVETNQDVRRWYDNMKRSSILNADVRLRRLNLFCDRVGKSPKQLVKRNTSSF